MSDLAQHGENVVATKSDDETRKVRFRGGGFSPKPRVLIAPIVFLVLLVIWELGSHFGLIPPIVLPSPTEVLEALKDLVQSGLLWKHLSASLYRLIIGFTCGTILGLIFGAFI